MEEASRNGGGMVEFVADTEQKVRRDVGISVLFVVWKQSCCKFTNFSHEDKPVQVKDTFCCMLKINKTRNTPTLILKSPFFLLMH